MGPLRLGMIGGGPGSAMGPVHRIAARLDGKWSLVAGAFSSDPERNTAAGREAFVEPARTYDDWRTMVAAEAARTDGRLDAIAVVTPNHLHAGPCIAALEAGFDVICDKPLAATLPDAEAIAQAARRTGRRLVLTQTYSGYPMVREARALVAAGAVGRIRLVDVEYAQGWLALPVEQAGTGGAAWRTDPAQGGAGGLLGDIGTHAFHLAGFVSGLAPRALFADLSTFVSGRRVPDNAHVLLRYDEGVRGKIWLSQVAASRGNDLRLAVHGDAGSLEWRQEDPNRLLVTRLGEATQVMERGSGVSGRPAGQTRLPAHHPEGYLEAFAQLYAEAAQLIGNGVQVAELPDAEDGVAGLRFIAAALTSAASESWCDISPSRRDAVDE